MDAPLVLTSRLDPAEIDKESLNVDVGSGYPLEFYLAAQYAHPKDLDALIDRVERSARHPGPCLRGSCSPMTPPTSRPVRSSPPIRCSSLWSTASGQNSTGREDPGRRRRRRAERVLKTHFMPDLMETSPPSPSRSSGAPGAAPVTGGCRSPDGAQSAGIRSSRPCMRAREEGLEISKEICHKYDVTEYTRVEVLDMAIQSTFGAAKEQQLGLADFM